MTRRRVLRQLTPLTPRDWYAVHVAAALAFAPFRCEYDCSVCAEAAGRAARCALRDYDRMRAGDA